MVRAERKERCNRQYALPENDRHHGQMTSVVAVASAVSLGIVSAVALVVWLFAAIRLMRLYGRASPSDERWPKTRRVQAFQLASFLVVLALAVAGWGQTGQPCFAVMGWVANRTHCLALAHSLFRLALSSSSQVG